MSKISFLRKATPPAVVFGSSNGRSPTFMDLPRLTPEPITAGISESSGWWLEFRPGCACGKTKQFSFQSMCETAHPYEPTLGEILPRVRCQSCGTGPESISLIDLEDASRASFRLRLK